MQTHVTSCARLSVYCVWSASPSFFPLRRDTDGTRCRGQVRFLWCLWIKVLTISVSGPLCSLGSGRYLFAPPLDCASKAEKTGWLRRLVISTAHQ